MKLAPLSQIKRKLTYERKGGKKAPRPADFTPKKPKLVGTETATKVKKHFSNKDLLEKTTIVRQLDMELSDPNNRCKKTDLEIVDQVKSSTPLLLGMLNSILVYCSI